MRRLLRSDLEAVKGDTRSGVPSTKGEWNPLGRRYAAIGGSFGAGGAAGAPARMLRAA